MKNINTKLLIAIAVLLACTPVHASGDDFNSVVKIIEKFYRVKHQGIPFLAKAGMKVATTAARIKGGEARRIAEAGSVKLAVFENQAFAGDFTLIQTLSAKNAEQNYIYLKNAGDKYNVLVINIEERDATVVQVTVSGKNLALLLKDPEGTGKSITQEATIIDQE
jgi:hypothetical protein